MTDLVHNCPLCKHEQNDCFCDWQEFVDRIEELEAIAYMNEKSLVDECIAAKGLCAIAERKYEALVERHSWAIQLTDDNNMPPWSERLNAMIDRALLKEDDDDS